MASSTSSTPLPTASWPLMRRILRQYVRPYVGTLAIAIVLMMISAAMTGAMAKLMEPIIDKIFTQQRRDMLFPVAGMVLLVFVVRGLATYGHTVMMNRMAQRCIADMQRDMFAHLVYADLAFFHGQQSGMLLSRFVSDV
ncbi:MAG: ABC transporter permease, partial [Alphaproteobacteria bacterium]|nr:ABC transporter permease [Alphaproteobacteria bacterium]